MTIYYVFGVIVLIALVALVVYFASRPTPSQGGLFGNAGIGGGNASTIAGGISGALGGLGAAGASIGAAVDGVQANRSLGNPS